MKQTPKKSELLALERIDAHLTIYLKRRIAVSVGMLMLYFFLIKPYVFPLIGRGWAGLIAIFYIPISFILPYFLFKKAIARGEDEELIRKRKERREQKVIELQMKFEQSKQKIANAVEEARTSYAVSKVFITDEAYVLHLELNEPMQEYPEGKYLMPKITVNGIPVATEMITEKKLWCHIRKAVNAEDKELVISTGKYNARIANPYYLDFSAGKQQQIQWQCEGHGHERRVKIPYSYFPNSHPSVQYSFVLYVHKSCKGVFYGRFIPEKGAVVILLDKTVHRSQCAGKQSWLRVDYGKGNKIMLPQPSVIAI